MGKANFCLKALIEKVLLNGN
ncbi:MAG: hypothetical protein PHO76_00410 [Methylotenera sp.]|nr:hypothetical protein [Methylotenera sp.]